MVRRKVITSQPISTRPKSEFVGRLAGVGSLSWLIGAVVVYLIPSLGALILVNGVQPDPYLDEVFHVPQTRKFCDGNFVEWDPKITTLPGTYLLVAGFLKGLGKIGMVSDPCTTFALRGCNLLLSCLNLILMYFIFEHMLPSASKLKIAVSALNLSTFPILYFFSFLYYTDTCSTFFVLLMHLNWLKYRYYLSAVFGGLSVLTRQTNIIWVLLHGGMIIWNFGIDFINEQKKFRDQSLSAMKTTAEADHAVVKGQLIVKRRGQPTSTKIKKAKRKSIPQTPGVTEIFLELFDNLMSDRMMGSMFGYVVVALVFAIFVWTNGGIVVGDKSAHQVSINIPQLGYFTIVFGFFIAPFILQRLRRTLIGMRTEVTIILGMLTFGFLAVFFNTVAHPYLLADNRHYPFYLWQRLFQRVGWTRYAMVPFYVFIWSFVVEVLGSRHALPFFLTCALSFVPQLLLEFRYFIFAFLYFRFHLKTVTWLELVLESVLFCLVNIVTIYLFAYKPFFWPDVEAPQRFMW